MNIFTFLGVVFLATFFLGVILEKIHIPWVFASLIIGLLLTIYNPFSSVTSSQTFKFLSDMGLYLLLFLIGFELNLKQIKNQGSFIIKATFLVEFLELIFIGILIFFIFKISFVIALLVAMTFATVGEAILLPILDEFKLTQTKLGQIILGIATFDDVFEVFVIICVVVIAPIFLNSNRVERNLNLESIALTIFFTLGLTVILWFLKKAKSGVRLFNTFDVVEAMPLVLSVLLLFIGISSSSLVDLSTLGAILAGLSAKHLMTEGKLKQFEPQIKIFTYSLFAPLFFLSVGIETNIHYLFSNFWLVILFIVVSYTAKIGASIVVGIKKLGLYSSIFMGAALGVRFSTSIVMIKILLDNKIINSNLYSILIGTSILFKFIVPFALSFLVKKVEKGSLSTLQTELSGA